MSIRLAPPVDLQLSYEKIVDVDATMIGEIYKHLRASEAKRRPCTDYMAKVQKKIDIRMRSMLIDWLVEVVEVYKLDPEILYLAVNYVDRFLSRNPMDTERLQLLGITCMMIASKYHNIDSLRVEEVCDLTGDCSTVDEICEMEYVVLDSLKFELTVPTARCFLQGFIYAVTEAELECMSNYLAELSLGDYGMLCYSPSLIAASSVFLARFILSPSRTPWNPTLQHFTLYKPRDLTECVKALHGLCCDSPNGGLPVAIRVKYSQHKCNCVANKYCPPSIPQEYFQDL